MAIERTLSIIKPDGVKRNLIGEILGRFEKAGLTVVAGRLFHLSEREAGWLLRCAPRASLLR